MQTERFRTVNFYKRNTACTARQPLYEMERNGDGSLETGLSMDGREEYEEPRGSDKSIYVRG